ncbi:MAG: 50S ribosomal protein L24 [Firmicutes bacterium]|nr:50S ribosomal protein L24 [Bacillota bacterium]
MTTLHVKKDDTVIVVSGDDRGKIGKVLEVSPEEKKVIVEGVNIIKRHVKPRKQGDQGGIISAEGAFYACKVMNYCQKCGKGVRVRVSADKNGKKIKVCAKCGAEL